MAYSSQTQAAQDAAPDTISVWEDDPGSGVRSPRPVPKPENQPLAVHIVDAALPPGDYPPGSAGLRYWTAADALRRSSDFWGPRVPGGRWQMGPVLEVRLDDGMDLNAYYDRRALVFFHGPGPHGTVYSGESPGRRLPRGRPRRARCAQAPALERGE